MRWIDIDLPRAGADQVFDSKLASARLLAGEIPAIGKQHGLDNIAVVERMAAVGRCLFQAVIGVEPEAFNPENDRQPVTVPRLGVPEHDRLVGYHLVVSPQHVGLPWTWLNNGLRFLLEKSPICASVHGAHVPAFDPPRSWMERYANVLFHEPDTPLAQLLPQLQPAGSTPPEILFIPGHCDEQVRSLMFREAARIDDALSAKSRQQPPATLTLPDRATTPRSLIDEGLTYQAIHFAGPTSLPLDIAATDTAQWVDGLLKGDWELSDAAVEEMVGLEADLVGIDPITALLDSVVEKFENQEADWRGAGDRQAAPDTVPVAAGADAAAVADVTGTTAKGGPGWLLDDGPVHPESLGCGGGVPPLVFSNSYCSVPELGNRFLSAGVSSFVGPVAPLFSRPARRFVARFYDFLADGLCTGAALRATALACRDELGKDHPAWLSYGVIGYGSLALQYL